MSNSIRNSSTRDSGEDAAPPPKSGGSSISVPDDLTHETHADSSEKNHVSVVQNRESVGQQQDKKVSASYSETSKEIDHSEPQICKICGKVYEDPDIKHIPSGVAWLSFSFLFICCLWWLSWIPFIVDQKHCNICKKPVKVCPFCYRRIDRPPV